MQMTDHGVQLLTEGMSSITNDCQCQVESDTAGEFVNAPYCEGYCWDDQLESFATDTAKLIAISNVWHVSGIQLWNRTVSGVFTADNTSELIRGITVNSDWNLRYQVLDTHLIGYLSHHDGAGWIKAYPMVVEENEEDEAYGGPY